MIIHSQFFITYYIGQQPLPLMSTPANLAPNTPARIDYDNFMQAVDTIYSSQQIDGRIPKFWTQRTQEIDQLGNIKYYYRPHPDSTLKQLDSKFSYYFIIRNTAAIPLKIPAIGGLLLGFTDASKLPNVISSSLIGTKLTDTSKVTITPKIENLQPYEEYIYEFKTVYANWPVGITNLSGIIKPSTDKASIETSIGFCPSSGACDSKTMPFTLPSQCSLTSSDNKSITMSLSIKPKSYDGPEVLSDHFTIECQDCLPTPAISIVDLSTKNVVEPIEDNADPAFYSYKLEVANLEIDKPYEYSIEVLKSEWPFVFTSPISGNIILRSPSDKPPLDGKIFFCPATGLCPPNQNGVGPYTVPVYPKFLTGSNAYNVILRAKLTSLECDNKAVYSNPTIISYRN